MAERLLLDTHALLWALFDPEELHDAAREAIATTENVVLVSPASLYEITLKVALGKLPPLPSDLLQSLMAIGFTELPIRLIHAATAGQLPLHHRDPFDRILIAHALLDGLVVVTRDPLFDPYGVRTLPC